MFEKGDYLRRGYNFLYNRISPHHKKASSLMIYATDVCDSACKHCLIWAKRPANYLSFESIKTIMKSKCINASTVVGLEGGEFLLHPEADKILKWFSEKHPNFDLFSNCLKPDKLIAAVEQYKPHRLYISLDGDKDTYYYMRGKDGYNSVLKVIDALKGKVPVFIMFTLSPYNDLNDLQHVAELCKAHGVFLRVGIYNNIPFFDTIDNAVSTGFGQLKNKEQLTFKKAQQLQEERKVTGSVDVQEQTDKLVDGHIPLIIKDFQENYDYVNLHKNWARGNLRLKCNSILDSIIILPDGSVPICQNLDLKLGNIHHLTLDEIFNSENSLKLQKHYAQNCNQCWISYHRKYDIALYRNFENFFGKWATSKMLGYYKWDENDKLSYKEAMKKITGL
jgi:MoaA/NifB/PqqE/SkfB family radical SAM enzyme